VITASFSAAYSWNILVKEIEQYAETALVEKPDSRVLEIGCGRGKLLAMLAQKHKKNKFFGIDIDKAAIIAAQTLKKKNRIKNVEFFAADIFSYCPKNKDLFEVVVCSEVLEHIEDTDNFLEKISFLLKPGGKLILSTPNKTNLPKLIFDKIAGSKADSLKKNFHRMNKKEDWMDEGHIALQGSRELEKRLARAGFAVKSVSRTPPLYGGRWVDNSKIIYNLNFFADSLLPRHRLLGFGWDMIFYAVKKQEKSEKDNET